MPIGTVKFFNSARGFGFIAPEDGSKDVFVHISAVEEAGLSILTEGQKVEYVLGVTTVALIWRTGGRADHSRRGSRDPGDQQHQGKSEHQFIHVHHEHFC